ncbi:MAG: PAS domain S-box protein [Candidatus Thorarchaeota archaeon]
MNKESDRNPASEEEFERIRRQYHALFNETSDSIFLLDMEGNHFEVNENAAKMLGYSVEELQNLSFRDVVYDNEIENAESKLELLLRGEKLPLYIRTFRRKDGSPFPAELNVALIRDDNGNPLYIQSIVRDITERERLAASLRESEKRYRLLADYAKDAIATLDMNLNFTFISPAANEVFGYEVDELLSKNIVDFLTPDSIKLVRDAMTEALRLEDEVGKDGYDAPPLEFETFHKKGHQIWIEVSRVFLRDDSDRPIGLLIVIRDITKRKLIEEALQRSEKRHRELIEFNPEGISIVDFDEQIIFANAAFADMLGYEIGELQGTSFFDLAEPAEREKITAQSSQRTEGVSSTYRLGLTRRNGTPIQARVSAVPWRNDAGEIAGAIAVVTDITERVRAEHRIASTNRDLELYATLLKHDLKNDLQIIIAQAETASIVYSQDDKVNNFCATTKNVADRMNRLLEIFSTPSSEIPDNLLDLLLPRITEYEKIYPEMKINIQSEYEKKSLRITQGRLIPVLFDNLFRNSYQHGGKKVRVGVTIMRRDNEIQIDFSNDGPKIDESIQSKLFQRGISTTGSGQGLYLCKRIAEAYGGDISLLPTKKGVTFRILFPAT